ncbi:MAG: hypothetical protein RL617_918, partial [Pseudomonadota bacterium]
MQWRVLFIKQTQSRSLRNIDGRALALA